MKRIKLNIILLFTIFSMAIAQEDNGKDIRVYTSPMGNYLQIMTDEDIKNEPTLMKDLDYFEVKRMVFRKKPTNGKEKDFKPTGTLQKATTKKQLLAAYPNGMFDEIKQLYQLSTDDSLVKYFAATELLADFPFINTRIETQMALGFVYLDKEVRKGDICYYKIERVNKDKQRSHWGYGLVHSGVGNYLLEKVHFDWVETIATDSSVHIKWQYDLANIPTPEEVDGGDIFDPEKARQFTGHYIHAFNIDAKVVSFENGEWVQRNVVKPTLDSTGRFINVSWFSRVTPDEPITACIIPQDFVYNEGIPGDTALAIATSNSKVQFIYGINVVDTTNGIHISWEGLPKKEYYTGIEISRYDKEDSLQVIAIVPSSDSVYIDRQLEVGIHYRYSVRALFVPLQNLEQKIGASGVGTYTKFNNPLPAFELSAANIGRNIHLKWNNYDEVSIYGFYIYRGTSPRSMDLIAGPIKDSTYLDSATALNGRSQYFYSIAAQNLAQDTSVNSNTVVIKPERNEIITPPSYLKFYSANGKLKVLWDDPRKDDNYIRGYALEKKISGATSFSVITPANYANNSFEDEVALGNKVTYRVRSISWDSTMGEYSPEFVFTPKSGSLGTVNVFTLRNVGNGIQINIPKTVYPDRDGYVIYKREISEESFSELKNLSESEFAYLDSSVQNGKLYVYAVALKTKNGEVGDTGKEVSLRRKQIVIR